MIEKNSRVTLTVAILFTSFILLALPNAIPSVGWPAIRDEFGLRQDSIGLLLVMGTLGHLISGAFNGRLMYLVGGRKLLLFSIFIFALSLYGLWLTPSWILMVLLWLILGWAAGTLDATGNTIVAARYNERIMNWLHGFFGVGATIGPLLISLVILLGSDWRGSAFLFGTLLLLLFIFLLIRDPLGDVPNSDSAENSGEESAVSGFKTIRQPIVLVTILFAFVYGGIEVSIGQWAFTLMTESRGFSGESARFWVSVYWGTFTFGRFLFGVISPWFPAKIWMRGCVIMTALSITLLMFPSNQFLLLSALALSGLAQAPIFATLISLMPSLAGQEHAANAIGYFVSAGGVGLALLPSAGGILAERFSLEAIPPFIFGLSLMLVILFELLLRVDASKTTSKLI